MLMTKFIVMLIGIGSFLGMTPETFACHYGFSYNPVVVAPVVVTPIVAYPYAPSVAVASPVYAAPVAYTPPVCETVVSAPVCQTVVSAPVVALASPVFAVKSFSYSPFSYGSVNAFSVNSFAVRNNFAFAKANHFGFAQNVAIAQSGNGSFAQAQVFNAKNFRGFRNNGGNAIAFSSGNQSIAVNGARNASLRSRNTIFGQRTVIRSR